MELFIIIILGVIVLLLLLGRYETSRKKTKILKGVDARYVTLKEDSPGEYLSTFNFQFGDSQTGKPSFLVADVETSGRIKHRNKDPRNLSNWPRIVQMCWYVFDKDGGLIYDRCEYFKQPRPLPRESIAIHGITDEICKEKGVDPVIVLNDFLEWCGKVDYMVAHNAEFDHNVIEANMRRFKVSDDFSIPYQCTMKIMEPIIKLPSTFSGKLYKYPKLEEVVNFLFFGNGMHASIDGHDADKDVAYTSRCYLEMKEREII